MKFMKKSLSLLLSLALMINILPASAMVAPEIETIISDITARYDGSITQSNGSKFFDEWQIIELISQGQVSKIDKQGYIDYLKGKLDIPDKGYHDNVKSMERAVIALSLLDIDATKFELTDGTIFNMLDAIANSPANVWGDRDLIDSVGEAFALSAYDSGDYEIKSSDYFNRDYLITKLLKSQNANGSWGGVDFTGMITTSLSEYYEINPDVRIALDKSVEWFSTSQSANGSWGSNSNSTAMVIVALSSLGINSQTDVRFIKDASAIDGLLTFKLSGESKFDFRSNVKENAMSTEQAYRALITYKKVSDTAKRYNIYKKNVVNPPVTPPVTPPVNPPVNPNPDTSNNINVSVEIKGDSNKGIILEKTNVTVPEKSVAWYAMKKLMTDKKIAYVNQSENYISSIAGLSEFDHGPNSGWFYYVNGKRPDVGVNDYVIKNGDNIRLSYTIDGKNDAISGSNGSENNPTIKPDAPIVTIPSIAGLPNSVSDFKDITASYSWASKEIDALIKKGVLRGTSDGQFSPEKAIKRADFIIMLTRALDLKTDVVSNFTDVSSDKYYYKEIGIAKELGIINGSGSGNFNPESEITREDMFVISHRALKKKNISLATGETNFNDKSNISSYASSAISELSSAGLVQGANGKINPKNNATRAETAVFVYRIMQKAS